MFRERAEGATAPQRQCSVGPDHRDGSVPGCEQVAHLARELFEQQRVHGVRPGDQAVTTRVVDQDRRRLPTPAAGLEELPQPPDVRLEAGAGAGGDALTPRGVPEGIDRDTAVGVDRQKREHRSGTHPGHRTLVDVDGDGQGAQVTHPHPPMLTAPRRHVLAHYTLQLRRQSVAWSQQTACPQNL